MNLITILYRGIKAEYIKAKGTKLLLLAIAVPIFINICVFLIGKKTPLPAKGISKTWYDLTDLTISLMSFNMILVAMIAIISLSIQTENKATAWKHLLTLPMPQWTVYVSKMLFLLIVLIGVQVLMFGGTLLTGWLLIQFRPELGIGNHAPDLYKMSGTLAKLFLSTLCIFGIQYWFSLRVKNYMVPIFIGGFAVMIFTFAAMFGWKEAKYMPYSYVVLFDKWIKGQISLNLIGGLPKFMWWGIVGFVVLSIGAVVDAVYKRVKA